MSQSKTEAEARAYLLECFAHDPGREPGAILQLRRKHRRLQPEEEHAPPPPREEIDAALHALGSSFFQLDPEALRSQLAGIDAGPYPDLNRHLERLQRVATLREDIDRAASDAELDADFLEAFRACVIAPRREAVRQQSDALERMKHTRWRKICQGSVRRIEKYHPSLATLTPGWFEQIKKKPNPIFGRRKKSGSVVGFIGIYFLIRLIVTLVRNLFGEGDST